MIHEVEKRNRNVQTTHVGVWRLIRKRKDYSGRIGEIRVQKKYTAS